MAAPGRTHDKTGDAVAIYQAGDLTIDIGRQRVLRGEQEIPLPKLSFDLLLALVRAAPNVVTLDALVEQVWPNVVVSPETLSQRIKLLREALDDDSRQPRYIASLRSRGYRFIPPVVRDGAAAALPPAPAASRTRLFLFAGVLSILAIVGAALVVAYTARHRSTGSIETTAASELPAHTVAVLPFQNLTTDKEDDSEVIAFGVAEGLLHRLASMRDLTLIARTSSFAAATAPAADARAIGRKLNARYLIEGSVQRSGERLRVTAQLIDAATGAHLWSLRFDRTIDDIFAVEDEITQNVAQALQVTLTERRHPYARFGTEAYLALLQGRALVASHKTADADAAIKRFQHAIAIAPDFAVAYVDLANAYVILAHLSVLYLSEPNRAAVERARPLVAKALQLDPTLGEAYVLRGFIEAFDRDVVQAEADYRRGLELAPSYGRGYEQFAEFLEVDLWRFDEALAAIDRARIVDPLRPRTHYIKGRMLAGVGAFDEAEALYLRAIEIAPDYYPALLRLGEARWEQGQFAEAVRLGERAVAIESTVQWPPFMLAEFYLDIGDVDAARAVLGNQADDFQWSSICMREGKVAQIVALAPSSIPEAVQFYEDEFVPFALRDAALAAGRPAEPRQMLAARWERVHRRPPSAEFWGTRIAFAQLQLATGHREEARQLARALLQIDDPHPAHGIQYAKPYAHVLVDDKAGALRALEHNVERGYLKRWWYTFEQEPFFQAAFGKDRQFQALAARVRKHVDSQRALLQQMRERGEVPARKLDASAVRTSC
ncbi:MAG TPA: tetratricopeptide repeat protein [Steroidobacteraceae bacterium]|nr:tetratricopeptide repeat protein [Steroidobacteraceae bacterium]